MQQKLIIIHLSSVFRLLSSVLYIYREPSTNQLLFMQNKPNLLDAQMNVSFFYKMDYENISDWTLGENKPKQSQFLYQELHWSFIITGLNKKGR